jgi:hypothetical protein
MIGILTVLAARVIVALAPVGLFGMTVLQLRNLGIRITRVA